MIGCLELAHILGSPAIDIVQGEWVIEVGWPLRGEERREEGRRIELRL